MTSAAGGEKTRGRARHFVPIDDVPGSGLSHRAREVLALAISAFGMYGLLCLATFRDRAIGSARIPGDGTANVGGTFGYYLANGFCFVFGFAAWVPFLLLLVYAVGLFLHRRFERPILKLLGSLVLTAMVALLLAGPGGSDGVSDLTPWGGGGRFGGNLSPRLFATFGGSGRILLVSFGALVSFLLVTEWLFTTLLQRCAQAIERLWRRLLRLPLPAEAAGVPAGAGVVAGLLDGSRDQGRRPQLLDDDDDAASSGRTPGLRSRATAPADDEDAVVGGGNGVSRQRGELPKPGRGARADIPDRDFDAGDELPARPPAAAAAPSPAVELPRPKVVVPKKPKPKPKPRPAAQSELPFDAQYPFPPVELFREPAQTDVGQTAQVLQRGSDAIILKLASFGLAAEVVSVSVGPAVAQYELRLAEGIRVGKIIGFEADLAAALKAVAVRVVAPIPGKDTIGIEVPNQERQRVFLRELLDLFGQAEDLAIPLFLGKDVAGNPIVEDLARMPHLLIAGTTGSGKSVCINAILLSILMTRTPAQVKLILVDPKMVELQAYKSVPHLCCEVVTSMKKAPAVLQWAVDEMENRYALLSAAGTNHIRSYNRLGQQELQKRLKRELEPERVHLPYIV
ncbi:MAG TPA: DNA translocase FtsK 4TM domain-containing protein, partial [Planctomycetota bacterium]|nr:DNA translocase FtsK 4TM domain-containing protein [Planctomycetota bacterium]